MKTELLDLKVFNGDCDKNIHWYQGEYRKGRHVFNQCAFCGKRQIV